MSDKHPHNPPNHHPHHRGGHHGHRHPVHRHHTHGTQHPHPTPASEARVVAKTPVQPVSHSSKKHPEQVMIDHSEPQERASGLTTETQRNLYFTYDASRGNLKRGQIAAAQVAGKKTQMKEVGAIYFPVDGTDVATAGKTAELQNVDDAPAYLESIVDRMVATNAKGRVVGHASYTAHNKVDIITDAQGNLTRIPHNEHLADGRAVNTQQMMDAIYQRKYPERAKKNPSLFSASALRVEARGDHDLAVKTTKEHDKNRSSTIEMEYQVVDESTLKYVVIQADAAYLNEIYRRRMDKTNPLDIPMEIDLGLKTDLGKFLKDNSKIKGLVPSRGSFLVNPADYAKFDKPVHLKVAAAEADDFRLLVSENAGKVSYVMNRDGSASIRVNGKPIINLYIQTPEGLAKPQDILVATVDKFEKDARGKETLANTKPVERDVQWEARRAEAIVRYKEEHQGEKTKQLAAQKEAEARAAVARKEQEAREAHDAALRQIVAKEHIQRREAIAADIDGNKDGKISYDELVSYRKEIINPMVSLGADGRTSLTVEDVAKKIHMYEDRNPELAEKFKAMIAKIGAPDGSVSAAQMTAVIQKRDEFNAMLSEGKFQIPKGGALAVADVHEKAADKSPANTDRPVASVTPPPSPFR